jgi:hypothetical protein
VDAVHGRYDQSLTSEQCPASFPTSIHISAPVASATHASFLGCSELDATEGREADFNLTEADLPQQVQLQQ